MDRCALDLCPENTQQSLRTFVAARMAGLLRTYASTTGMQPPPSNALSPHEAWHLFESHLVTHDTRQGKSYKLWLKEHAQLDHTDPLSGIESGASLLTRDVAREHLRKEGLRSASMPLDSPLPGSAGTAYTLHDLLPAPGNPYDTMDAAKLSTLADDASVAISTQLSRRQKLVLLARALKYSLTSRDVIALAGCSKSVLFDTYQESLHAIASHVQRSFSTEDRETRARLAILVLEKLQPGLLLWGLADPCLSHLCMNRPAADSTAYRPLPETGAPAILPSDPQTVTAEAGAR